MINVKSITSTQTLHDMENNAALAALTCHANTHIYDDFTRKGKCSHCGKCCSNFLPLSASEISHISLYISEHHILPMPLVRGGKYVYADTCPFLDAHKKCMIYDARPLICKVFKCNRNVSSNKYRRLLLLEDRKVVDVRDTFFPMEVQLSEHEMNILKLLAKGYSLEEIAAIIDAASTSAVSNQLQRLSRKLGVSGLVNILLHLAPINGLLHDLRRSSNE